MGKRQVGRYSKDEISSSVEVWLEIDRASLGLAFVQGLVLGLVVGNDLARDGMRDGDR